jgi:iron complex outermembrane recepter protein
MLVTKGWWFSGLLVASAAAYADPPEQQTSATDGSAGLQEITVTAEKYSSTLHEVPASVTAMTGSELTAVGVAAPLDLAKVIPGATFRTRGPVTQMFIRGVGSNVDSPQVLPGVATQMNGIYVPREATGGSFFDLERVELLPGPQGTLYGRDAAGGTVNINFNRPKPGNESDVTLEGGNYDFWHVTGAQNVEASDKAMFRAAVDVQRRHGYLSNGANDLDSTAGRLSALLTPVNNLSVLLWGSFWHNGGKGPEVVASPLLNPDDPWQIQPAVPAGTSLFESYMGGGEIAWSLDSLTVTYIPGFSHFREDDFESFGSPAYALKAPGAAFTLHINQHWKNNTQELRFNQDINDDLRWLAGLYWYSQDIFYDRHQTTTLSHVTSTVISVPDQTNSGYAAYGQPTYSPLPWLHITGGLRLASDSLDVSGINSAGNTPFAANHDWKHVEWKAGVQMEINPDSNVYATVQTGYLRGGYSPAALSAKIGGIVPTHLVEPEKLLSYVLGSKNKLLDNRLQINDEFYYYDYKDYQISAIDLTTNVSSFLNAQKVVIVGNQLDVKWLATRDDEISLSAVWNHGRAKQFNLPGVGVFTGYNIPNSPYLTAILGYQHTWTLADGAAVSFRADTHFETESYLLYDHHNGSRQPAYSNTSTSLTYRCANERWDVALWARNLENEAIYGAGATVGPIGAVYLGDPRTYGIRVGAHF